MKKKTLSMLLVAGMLSASFTGCGNTPGSSGNLGTESTTKTEEKTTESEEKTTKTEESTVTQDPVEIRIFSAYNADDETEWSKFIVKELEKAVNVKLVRDEVPSSGYQEKLQLAMSDGDYPDAFIFNNHADSMLESAVNDGLIIPLNEYLENGSYPNLENYIYDEAWEVTKIKNDENIYLIPRCTVARCDGFAVRADWMEKVGFEFSTDDNSVTKEEFLELMRKFTEEDPDGDGVDNTYGFVWNTTSSGNLNVIAGGAFDCLDWQESDGEFEYMSDAYDLHSEKFKELLAYNQQLYQYAHPDSAVTTDSNVLLIGGQVGVMNCFPGYVGDRDVSCKEVNADASLTYLSGILNDEGILHGSSASPGIWGGLAITKNCEHPEKVLEIVDWLLSDQGWEYALWGIPGVIYEKQADGSCVIIDAEAYRTQKAKGVWASDIARRKENTDFFMDLSADEETYSRLKGWLDTAVNAVVFAKHLGKSPDTTSDTVFIEADNKRKETITKIIMGAAPVDEYDKVLEEWYEKGGREYIEQMNEIIRQLNQ